MARQFNCQSETQDESNFMIRRFDEPQVMGKNYTTRHGVYGVLVRDNQLLITFQSQPQSEYQLPGGGIDPGESPTYALHREVREETGYRIAIQRRLGAFQRYTYMPEYDMWARKVCQIYLCRPARALSPPTEPHHVALWVSFEEAVDILGNGGDRHFVRDFHRLIA